MGYHGTNEWSHRCIAWIEQSLRPSCPKETNERIPHQVEPELFGFTQDEGRRNGIYSLSTLTQI